MNGLHNRVSFLTLSNIISSKYSTVTWSRTTKSDGELPQHSAVDKGVLALAGWIVGVLYSIEFSRIYIYREDDTSFTIYSG
jgi:hypothetical protein